VLPKARGPLGHRITPVQIEMDHFIHRFEKDKNKIKNSAIHIPNVTDKDSIGENKLCRQQHNKSLKYT
jgi:hypothetical protein